MEVDTQEIERPKTPTQLRRLQEEEKKERMAQAEKEGSSELRKDNAVDDKGTENEGNNEMNTRKEKGKDDVKIGDLRIDDPSTASPEKGNFRDFIFSPKTETISSSSSPLQRNQLKAMM